MTFTWKFSTKYATEFDNLPIADQDKIFDFTDIFESHGLEDFTLYEGKIAPSWSGSNISPKDYAYAKENSLWHYHIGIPEYTENHPKYKTSDYLLHFQWKDNGRSINIVDLYSHYTSDNDFYLPASCYLSIPDE